MIAFAVISALMLFPAALYVTFISDPLAFTIYNSTTGLFLLILFISFLISGWRLRQMINSARRSSSLKFSPNDSLTIFLNRVQFFFFFSSQLSFIFFSPARAGSYFPSSRLHIISFVNSE
jgi:hypothetical protein